MDVIKWSYSSIGLIEGTPKSWFLKDWETIRKLEGNDKPLSVVTLKILREENALSPFSIHPLIKGISIDNGDNWITW